MVVRMKLVTVHLPKMYVVGLDELIRADIYPNRSEAIRTAVREFLKRELLEIQQAIVVARA